MNCKKSKYTWLIVKEWRWCWKISYCWIGYCNTLILSKIHIMVCLYMLILKVWFWKQISYRETVSNAQKIQCWLKNNFLIIQYCKKFLLVNSISTPLQVIFIWVLHTLHKIYLVSYLSKIFKKKNQKTNNTYTSLKEGSWMNSISIIL